MMGRRLQLRREILLLIFLQMQQTESRETSMGCGALQLDAVAEDVVLVRQDCQRVLGLERFEPALRHRERVMAELDLAGLLAALVHREIDDPAEAEGALLNQPQFAADAGARLRRE